MMSSESEYRLMEGKLFSGEGAENEKNIDLNKISLRPMDLSDLDDLMVWATDEKVTKFCTWETYSSKEEGVKYINEKAIPHPWLRAICLDNRAIGSVLVTPNNTDLDKCRAELGYVLASMYWGKGIATQAVKLVAKTIFNEWPQLERLEALVDVENVGSQKVLEKVGFTREGVLRKFMVLKGKIRSMVIFSLLSSDPQI